MATLCPQNGDRIVAIDGVTSFHHMYNNTDLICKEYLTAT